MSPACPPDRAPPAPFVSRPSPDRGRDYFAQGRRTTEATAGFGSWEHRQPRTLGRPEYCRDRRYLGARRTVSSPPQRIRCHLAPCTVNPMLAPERVGAAAPLGNDALVRRLGLRFDASAFTVGQLTKPRKQLDEAHKAANRVVEPISTKLRCAEIRHGWFFPSPSDSTTGVPCPCWRILALLP